VGGGAYRREFSLVGGVWEIWGVGEARRGKSVGGV
jgi:hypothetical protein